MATLDMLNVAIGIIFIYLLLSLIATALNEIIENVLKNRASNLERGIRELIEPTEGKEPSLVQKFYEHPLICGLYKGSFKSKKNLPSYIPASSFSLVVIDLIVSNATANVEATAKADAPPITVETLKQALQQWPYEHSKKAVQTLLEDAEGDLAKAKDNLEMWFNGSMDRVAGWYKRKIQKILIVIGFVLAGIMNADSIAIFKSLVKDAPLRNSLVAASAEFAKAPDESNSGPKSRFDKNMQRINDLRLPLGWDWRESEANFGNYSLAIPIDDGKGLFWSWVAKIAGLIITGVAVSLGAPFWFDTLNKVMVIRSTVKPREKSQDEASEDKQKKEPTKTK